MLEKIAICGFYTEFYVSSELSTNVIGAALASALPELWAPLLALSVKARQYLGARCKRYLYWAYGRYRTMILGIKKLQCGLKPFEIELKPFLDEISLKERVIREYLDTPTLVRIKGIHSSLLPKK